MNREFISLVILKKINFKAYHFKQNKFINHAYPKLSSDIACVVNSVGNHINLMELAYYYI